MAPEARGEASILHTHEPEKRETTSDAPLEKEPGRQNAPARMVTLRAVLIALLLTPINAYWIILIEVTRYSGHPTTISLFFNVVFLLVVLIALNALVGKVWPRARLAPGELLTVYIMLGIASAITGHDMIEVLVPLLAHVHYFARPENNWATEIVPHVPNWLSVSDPQALREFYTGTGSFYAWHNLSVWIGPILWWTAFLTVLCFVMLCLNTLLRRQWTQYEKLAYPLVMLPLEMVNPRTQLFKTRLFWGGVCLAASLELWNGLAYLYPSIPRLPLKRFDSAQDINTYLTSPPWNALSNISFTPYPIGIGLGMLLPVDLLFSTWFFTWAWRLIPVFGAMYGYNREGGGFPYQEPQGFGAYLGVAIAALWVSRRQFLALWRGLWDRRNDLGDAHEPLPYRWAVLGIAVGSVAIFLFCRACGMTPVMIVAFFGLYLLISVSITRMRAEFGPPAHDLQASGPDNTIPLAMSSAQISRPDLTMFSMFYGFNRAYRSHPMPIQLEGFKIGERLGGNYRALFGAMMLAVVFGALCAFWADLDQSYRYGAAEKMAPPNVQLIFGSEPWNRMQGWLQSPSSPGHQMAYRFNVLIGIGVTLLLSALRLRYAQFPLHPVGYAVSGDWAMSLLWTSLFIAWIIKVLLLRYGGLRAYRHFLPFFLGIVLGECVIGSLWTLIGIAFHIPTYAFWP
jgi:hypothetical protein